MRYTALKVNQKVDNFGVYCIAYWDDMSQAQNAETRANYNVTNYNSFGHNHRQRLGASSILREGLIT